MAKETEVEDHGEGDLGRILDVGFGGGLGPLRWVMRVPLMEFEELQFSEQTLPKKKPWVTLVHCTCSWRRNPCTPSLYNSLQCHPKEPSASAEVQPTGAVEHELRQRGWRRGVIPDALYGSRAAITYDAGEFPAGSCKQSVQHQKQPPQKDGAFMVMDLSFWREKLIDMYNVSSCCLPLHDWFGLK
ncbi:hypothetical protein U1Q18_013862, partial [Sarracenia purpurea var. burkii]